MNHLLLLVLVTLAAAIMPPSYEFEDPFGFPPSTNNYFDFPYGKLYPSVQYQPFANAINNNDAARLYQLNNGLNCNPSSAVTNIKQALQNEINRVVSNEQRKIDSYAPLFSRQLYY